MGLGLDGKVVTITGAASGIGKAAAELFAAAGARLVLADVDSVGVAALTAQITDAGGTARYLRVDVTDEADVRGMVDLALREFGRLDGSFNNAAIGYAGRPLHLVSLDEWHRTLEVNLTGVFLCMKHELAAMMRQGYGSIVNTGSVASTAALPNASEYNAAKHGVLGLSRNAALDYGSHGIRVNALLPGSTVTPLVTKQRAINAVTPSEDQIRISALRRVAEPREIAEAALWLLSDAASYVTGAAMPVDGGYTVS